MVNASTFRFFTHVEVDSLEQIPVEDSDTLRLPDLRKLEQLERLRIEFLNRWQAGDPVHDLVKRIFAVPMDIFLPAQPARYLVGYNVECAVQARAFRKVMRDLDRYIAALSQFALRVRVLSVVEPLPEHPSGYADLQSVLRTIRYVGEGRWLKAVSDFEHQRRKTVCWRILPHTLTIDGAVPEYMADALELLLYKAQIVRILAGDPAGELHSALAEGADEYVHALEKVVQAMLARRHKRVSVLSPQCHVQRRRQLTTS
ncbi:MAG: hypothetical protein C4335_06605 [Armatimonadota bacterium]